MLEGNLVVADDCVAEKLDNELIVLNLSSGMYHQINAVGIVIWQEIQEKSPSFATLVESLQQKFDSPDITDDVRVFVKDLIERGIILQK